MMTYVYGHVKSHGEQVIYQSCLGIYKCPTTGCKFICSAVKPRQNIFNGAKPTTAFGSDKCLLHGVLFDVTIRYSGRHKHDCPHETVSKQAVARLEDMLQFNSNAKPIQILQGSPTRKPARSIHPALNNLDRLNYYMRQSKSKVPTLKVQDLGSWQGSLGCDFLKKSDL